MRHCHWGDTQQDSFIICNKRHQPYTDTKIDKCGASFFWGEAILVRVFCEALSSNNVFEPWIIKSYADAYNSVKYNIADCTINFWLRVLSLVTQWHWLCACDTGHAAILKIDTRHGGPPPPLRGPSNIGYGLPSVANDITSNQHFKVYYKLFCFFNN